MLDVVYRILRRSGFKPAPATKSAIALAILIGAAPAAYAQTADEACRQTLAQTVEFASDKTTLDGKARALVKRQAKCLEGGAGAVTVEGFWDDSSTQTRARELSLRLATRVREELVKNGVAEGRVKTVGHGRDQSLDPAQPHERRRVVRVAP